MKTTLFMSLVLAVVAVHSAAVPESGLVSLSSAAGSEMF